VIRILNFWLLGESSNFWRLQRDLGEMQSLDRAPQIAFAAHVAVAGLDYSIPKKGS
jgi:hypothetical protein